MAGETKSQKSGLYYASAATTASKVPKVTNVQGLGGPRDQIDVTSFDNDDREFLPGFGNPGQVTVDAIFDTGSSVLAALFALKDAGTVVSWGMYSSQAATAPTAVGSEMQTVVDRTSAIFNAYVSDMNVTVAGNDVWKVSIVLQRSGNVSWDFVT